MFILPIYSRKMGLHSLTLRMNIIAHYFIVAWETLSWVRDKIICKYFGYFSKGICDLWLIWTKFVISLSIETSCPGAKIFYRTSSLTSMLSICYLLISRATELKSFFLAYFYISTRSPTLDLYRVDSIFLYSKYEIYR